VDDGAIVAPIIEEINAHNADSLSSIRRQSTA